MTNEQIDNLQEWLMQRELEAYRQAAKRSNNTKRTTYFKERAGAFQNALTYYKSLRCKAKVPEGDNRIAKDPAGVFQQCLHWSIATSNDMRKAAAKDDIRTRIRCHALAGALLDVLEFLNAGRNQGQE